MRPSPRLEEVQALVRSMAEGPRTDPKHVQINLTWLLRLRWVAVLGQTSIAIAAAVFLDANVPIFWSLSLVVLLATTNLAVGLIASNAPDRVRAWWMDLILALDVLLLSGHLALTGGAKNPFSLFYLVHVALGAMLLRSRGTWVISLLSVLGFFVLFHLPYQNVAIREDIARHEEEGLLVALAIAAAIVGYFVHRIQASLEAREDELGQIRAEMARDEKLASLATLAAGAAHELATPLATIAVAAKEMDRALATNGGALADDARLIREQVDRCRTILQQMAARAGETAGETATPLDLQRLLEEAVSGLSRGRIDLEVANELADTRWTLPLQALAHALRGIIKNAIDASPPEHVVKVSARLDPQHLELAVEDRGHGMDPDVARRAGEPFFTTKEPGRGMGLGLCLARSGVERLGGRLAIRTAPDAGTQVVLSLPREGLMSRVERASIPA